MLPDSPPSRLRSIARLPAARLGAVASALLVAVAIGCSSKIQIVTIGLPVMTPFMATAGQKVQVMVQLLDKAGCGTATISANYNGAVISSKQVGAGAFYSDTLVAVLGQRFVQATGTCGDAIQTRTDSFVVNP